MMSIEIRINGTLLGAANVVNIGQPGPRKEATYHVTYSRIDGEMHRDFEITHDRDDGAEALAERVMFWIRRDGK